ncbi:hypothetical protein HYS28_00790 [Candidatus Uhrbacteria bacterium]|nr:hypothetical protein [Candidatus Uhrbacteria bacterium]
MQDEVKHAHCIGAGGIGVSAVAKFLLSRGVAVSGSDTVRSAMTDDLAARGATITIGHDAANIPASCDLVVYTEAAGEDNVERAEAARRGIRQLGHFGFLGELAKTMRTICVTGTNGKSTTTAMTGKIFEDAGMDPTVFVGSLVPGWELGNLRIGASDILIVEGDEYKRKVLALHPETTLVTNVELDHTDVYKDLADMEAMFRQLGMQTTKTFFHNAADRARRIYRGDGTATLKFFGDAMDAEPRRFEGGYQLLRLYRSRGFLRRRAIIGDLMLQIPGAFNMMNALAALAIASEYGIGAHIALQTLMNFTGIWMSSPITATIRLPLPARSPRRKSFSLVGASCSPSSRISTTARKNSSTSSSRRSTTLMSLSSRKFTVCKAGRTRRMRSRVWIS